MERKTLVVDRTWLNIFVPLLVDCRRITSWFFFVEGSCYVVGQSKKESTSERTKSQCIQ